MNWIPPRTGRAGAFVSFFLAGAFTLVTVAFFAAPLIALPFFAGPFPAGALASAAFPSPPAMGAASPAGFSSLFLAAFLNGSFFSTGPPGSTVSSARALLLLQSSISAVRPIVAAAGLPVKGSGTVAGGRPNGLQSPSRVDRLARPATAAKPPDASRQPDGTGPGAAAPARSVEGSGPIATISGSDRRSWRKFEEAVDDPRERIDLERALRDSVLAGDESAWRVLYERSFGPLWTYLQWRSGRRIDRTEEAVQECWLVAVRRIAEFDPERGTFEGWLRGIGGLVLRG